jgi:virulence-associated protein VapD
MKAFREILNDFNKQRILSISKIINFSEEDFIQLWNYSKNFVHPILGKLINEGGESYVFEKENKVNKLFIFSNYSDTPWSELKTKIGTHNKIFPETKYSINYVVKLPEEFSQNLLTEILDDCMSIGKSEFEEVIQNDYLPVLTQDKINNVGKIPYEDIKETMNKKGFKEVKHSEFSNDKYYIEDINTKNTGESNGKILIFDPSIREIRSEII